MVAFRTTTMDSKCNHSTAKRLAASERVWSLAKPHFHPMTTAIWNMEHNCYIKAIISCCDWNWNHDRNCILNPWSICSQPWRNLNPPKSRVFHALSFATWILITPLNLFAFRYNFSNFKKAHLGRRGTSCCASEHPPGHRRNELQRRPEACTSTKTWGKPLQCLVGFLQSEVIGEREQGREFLTMKMMKFLQINTCLVLILKPFIQIHQEALCQNPKFQTFFFFFQIGSGFGDLLWQRRLTTLLLLFQWSIFPGSCVGRLWQVIENGSIFCISFWGGDQVLKEGKSFRAIF